jgi:tetratricopeptide (TPR) repeat protein
LVAFPGSARARLVLALALEQLHRVPEALRELEEVHRKAPDAPLVRGALGHAYAASGRMDEAQQILNHLERLPRGQSDFYSRAMVYAGLGEVSRAIGEFEKACERREFHLVLLGVDRRLDPLRSHPEFKAVLEQIGLA